MAVVAVRVPGKDGGDLATAASRRLEAGSDLAAVEVAAIRGLQPALAATLLTVEVEVRTDCALDRRAFEERLAAAPGTQRVEEIRPD